MNFCRFSLRHKLFVSLSIVMYFSFIVILLYPGLQGIYISRIQEDSLAEKCGLRPGDQILSTNYTSFMDGITCKQAFRIICENDCLLFNICPRHEELSLQRKHHSYAWIDADGRPTTTLIEEPSLMERQINSINTSPFQRKSPIEEFE